MGRQTGAAEGRGSKPACAGLDVPKEPPPVQGTATYQKFAQDTFAREKALIEKLGLAKPQ